MLLLFVFIFNYEIPLIANVKYFKFISTIFAVYNFFLIKFQYSLGLAIFFRFLYILYVGSTTRNRHVSHLTQVLIYCLKMFFQVFKLVGHDLKHS